MYSVLIIAAISLVSSKIYIITTVHVAVLKSTLTNLNSVSLKE